MSIFSKESVSVKVCSYLAKKNVFAFKNEGSDISSSFFVRCVVKLQRCNKIRLAHLCCISLFQCFR